MISLDKENGQRGGDMRVSKNSKVLPTVRQLKKELRREMWKKEARNILIVRQSILVTICAIAILISNFLTPVLRIDGLSMEPTLKENDVVVAINSNSIKQGDVIAFYYNNKILVKRAIAFSYDIVDIDENGRVSVNGKNLAEPYVESRALGECNIEMPYTVPENRIFVMGDHRLTSVDSRNSVVGCVSNEQIVGKILFRLWPIERLGKNAF